MKVDNLKDTEKIWLKLNELFDFDRYYDSLTLSSDDYWTKHQSFGGFFKNYFEIRFEKGENILHQIEVFLNKETTYYIIPISLKKEIFEVKCNKIQSFFLENNISNENFIILEKKMTWSLVKDKHGKLIGVGNYITKLMQKQINMRFGDARIMHSINDSQE